MSSQKLTRPIFSMTNRKIHKLKDKTVFLECTHMITERHTLERTKYGSEMTDSALQIFLSLSPEKSWFSGEQQGFYENARFSTVAKLDFTDSFIANIPRAGIIYFTFIDNKLHMCFGRDRKTGDLTDFSGMKKTRETPVSCALREGYEESRMVFGEVSEFQIRQFICLYSTQMLIIFVPVVAPPGADVIKITQHNFETKHFLSPRQRNYRCFNEISELVWLNETQISNLFSLNPRQKLYLKVRRFIYSCRQFSLTIDQMRDILKDGLISSSNCEIYESQFYLQSKYFRTTMKYYAPKTKDIYTITNLTQAIQNSLIESA